ncbi:MAG: 1,4-dihydroxy-2-naphthoate polyprenyltransferase [Candidatus Marinimicrobia bacterium]|nr:1,4-dihydroxy-2-naphthoate polyprenyltransferase [Candidatus Neomarinimicrobiota bacterium]MBL7109004.1 1,4-dihydroxy-2-naphthoate polyprenyltransferase [Candidatus Neomarinimicrobiota bacterium]
MNNSWLIAIRPKTLPAAISPVLVGIALAYHDNEFHLLVAIATLFAAVLLQIGSNLANDVFDFLKGADTENRLGPKRVTQSGLLTPSQVKNGMVVTFVLALFIGCYLAFIGGLSIVIIGIASIIAGVIYTGGPYPLGYHGWGDVFVFLFFGIIAVPGTYYLQTGIISAESILLGIAIGAISTAILVVNNLRDIKTDSKAGKKTLAVRFGTLFVKIEYILLLVIAYLIPTILALKWNQLSLFLPIFSIPLAVRLAIRLSTESGKFLNEVLVQTAKLLFIFALLLTFGILL